MEEAKGLIITGIVTLLILGGGIFLLSKKNDTPVKQTSIDQSILVRVDSHQTNPSAKVTVVEFGDYRCPACKSAFPTTQQVIKDYGDKINFVFRNYAFLPNSTTDSSSSASNLAANAVECASDQNKFWEMHDWFYTNQPQEGDNKIYTIDNLTKVAGTLGVDQTKFKACLSANSDDSRVKQDFADGQVAGVSGTPSFYINGSLLPGVPSYSDFKGILDQLLK
ncbi:hypothetical protein BH10PAT1_BH10PAT1_4710 [soil metagenome]